MLVVADTVGICLWEMSLKQETLILYIKLWNNVPKSTVTPFLMVVKPQVTAVILKMEILPYVKAEAPFMTVANDEMDDVIDDYVMCADSKLRNMTEDEMNVGHSLMTLCPGQNTCNEMVYTI